MRHLCDIKNIKFTMTKPVFDIFCEINLTRDKLKDAFNIYMYVCAFSSFCIVFHVFSIYLLSIAK